MMQITNEIPVKTASMTLVPKKRPYVSPEEGARTIEYLEDNLRIPAVLKGSFYKLCNISMPESKTMPSKDLEEIIFRSNKQKDIYLRYLDGKPLTSVTSRFEEVNLKEIAAEVESLTGTSPIVRYFSEKERIQLMFPTAFNDLYLSIDSADYGACGGSGRNAISYGLAWDNGEFVYMTQFLASELLRKTGRAIHRKGKMIEKRIGSILGCAESLELSIEESKKKIFSRDQVEEYLAMYSGKLTERMTWPLRKSLKDQITAYDFSRKLTAFSGTRLSDAVRLKAEYLAGEIILCYDAIKQKLDERIAEGNRAREEWAQKMAAYK